MSDINLLPEDLRSREEKEQAKKRPSQPSSTFHLPEEKKPTPPPGKDESKVSITVNGKREWELPDRDKKAPPEKKLEKPTPLLIKTLTEKKVKPKKGKGFLNRLFGKKEKKVISKKAELAPTGQEFPANNLVKDIERLNKDQSVIPPQVKQPIPKEKSPKEFVKTLPEVKEAKTPKGKGFFSKLFRKKPVLPKSIKETPLPVEKDRKILEVAAKEPEPTKPKSTIFGRAIDVNLLPEGVGLLSIKKLMTYFGLAVLVGIILLAVVSIGLIFYDQGIAKQIKQTDEQIVLLEDSFKDLKTKEDEALVWSNKVEAIGALLERHIYWSKFFPELEKVTIPDVYYTSIGATSDGYVILTASASSYTALARQYIVLQNNQEVFPEMQISGITGSERGVIFNIQLKLTPEIYYSLEQERL